MAQPLLEIKIDKPSWDRLRRYMQDGVKGIPNALRLAVNRTADEGYTETHRTIRKLLNVKQSDLTRPHRFGNNRPLLTKRHAPKDSKEPTAQVLLQGERRIPIWRLGGKATLGVARISTMAVRYLVNGKWITHPHLRRKVPKVRKQPRWRIQYTIRPGQQKTIGDGPFKATFASGHTGIFMRKRGHKRAVGTELKGPSVLRVAHESSDIAKLFKQDMSKQLDKNIDQQIARLLDKQLKRSLRRAASANAT
jgi:hypothetical protein